MTSSPEQSTVGTAAEAVRETAPPDDAGAATLDRYEWQAAMAAADALASYLQFMESNGAGSPARVDLICELHEDWVLITGADAEIVSAKHKESEFGAYTTLRSLLTDGGVLHLYLRWKALGRTPTCRLVTTAGISGPPRKFVAACEELHRGVTPEAGGFVEVVESFASALNEEGERVAFSEASAFMATLRIQDSCPRREHIPEYAPSAFAGPVATRLGRSDAAVAIWAAVLTTVRERMRAAGPRLRGALPNVLGARDEENHERRTLTHTELHTIVSVALRNTNAYQPLPRAARTSRVALKMVEGGCTDNAIERAEVLRLQNRKYWRIRATTPGALAERESVLNRLRQIADEETDEAAADGGRWGKQLWRRLDERTREFAGDERALGLDADLLLGGFCDLSNRCEVWFSDRFDIELRTTGKGNGDS